MTTVYLQIDQNVKVQTEHFCLKDVAKVSCRDKTLEAKLKLLKLSARKIYGPGMYVYSVMDVIREIQREYPSVEVNNLGEADFIVTVERTDPPGRMMQKIKAAGLILLSFFGAAFSIMAFHNDIDITKLFGQIYYRFTGRISDGFTILEISYSIGVGAGLLIYVNHFAKRRLTEDPTPLEIEMRNYEDQVNAALIEADRRDPAERKKEQKCGRTSIKRQKTP